MNPEVTQHVGEPKYFLVWMGVWITALTVLLRCLS